MASRITSQTWLVILAGIALVSISGCGSTSKNISLTEAATGPAKMLKVATVRAVTRQVSSSVQVTGSFLAEESSDVAPPAAGRVISTPVDAGAFVNEGQVLAKLEDRDAQLRLQAAQASEQQAEASLRQAESHIGLSQGGKFDANNVPEVLSAKASYDSAVAQARMSEADAQRYDALIKTGDVSQSAYDKARTQADTAKEQTNSARQLYEASLNSARQSFQGVLNAQASLAYAQAQTAIARKAVDDTIIKAPFAGYISARPVAVGQYVALTSKIATLVRVTPLKLELQVQESNAPQLKIGAEVEASVPGYPGRTFHGTVTAINPTVDSNSRTVSVEAKFANADLALKPGMFGTARILLKGSTMGIFLPRATVITDPSTNSSQIFFVRDGKARVAVVQLGAVDGDLIQILSGITADFVVATNHLQDLFDGEPVDTGGSAPAATGAIPKTRLLTRLPHAIPREPAHA
ncbi:MAG TPA: efflux RND transporter periplasmic adaptor subunit [Bryobacteraceae bacterium]|nr:efflux RND transporter periplasmic adaptor subunit [Bryobacteraceae bacterium]